MIELVLVFCLVSHGDTCMERRVPFDVEPSTMQCMMNAQGRAMQFLRLHPEWRLAGWRCEVNKPRDT
jgi:hypothetical protein